MKRKALIVAVLALACGFAAVLVWRLTDCATVYMDGETTKLSFTDSWRFRKVLARDPEKSVGGGFGCFTNYGCGFSEDFSIRMGGLTYCFGQDGCESIYVSELDFYYAVSEENHEEIHRLLDEVVGVQP